MIYYSISSILILFAGLYSYLLDFAISQSAFTCPMSTVKTLEQGVKYVQSYMNDASGSKFEHISLTPCSSVSIVNFEQRIPCVCSTLFLIFVSFAESLAPTAHYNHLRYRIFLAGLFVTKTTAMLLLCSLAEADLETLQDVRWSFSRQ